MFNKRFVPFAHAKNIYELSDEFFKKLNVKLVLSDLDNTLDNITVLTPSKESIAFKKRLESLGIKIIIISNNTSSRVTNYAKDLGVEYRSNMKKPFSYKIKKFIKDEGIDLSSTIMIGDQIMTDVIAATGSGIRMVLTEPLREPEPIWTKTNRLFEKPIKKHIIKKGLMIDWRKRI